jgi:hypothetical protein
MFTRNSSKESLTFTKHVYARSLFIYLFKFNVYNLRQVPILQKAITRQTIVMKTAYFIRYDMTL